LPHSFKKLAWAVLVIWALAACITAIVYGLSFDIAVSSTPKTSDDECWDDASLIAQIESRLSAQMLDAQQTERRAENASSYGGSDSASWLLSILQSLLTSLLLWQPLTVYCVAWLKVWMFTWHLKLKVGPGNVLALCRLCCCGPTSTTPEGGRGRQIRKQLSRRVRHSMHSMMAQTASSKARCAVVANENRPVDAISFLGNERWIIDDVTEPQPQTTNESESASESESEEDIEMLNEMLTRVVSDIDEIDNAHAKESESETEAVDVARMSELLDTIVSADIEMQQVEDPARREDADGDGDGVAVD
jgi:hypothetical protein